MEALEITFRFGSPVLVDSEYPIHLDALLAYGVMKDAENLGEEDPWVIAEDLSACLERTAGDPWVWKASRLLFTPARGRQLYDMTNMIRRSEPERYYEDHMAGYWESRRRMNPETFTINTRSGQQRAYQWYAASRWMKEAKAWAIGDLEAVRYYLGFVSHVGKMGRNGYGRVAALGVEPAPADAADNWKLRCLPVGEAGKSGVQYEPVSACLHPPYWRRTARRKVLEPLV